VVVGWAGVKMLEREQRPLGTDRFPSAIEEAASQAGRTVARPAHRRRSPFELAVSAWRWALVHSRAVVGLVLVAGAGVWAIARGLAYYGLSPVHLAYDLDQPPWVLLFVSGWLWYRSRRR
jgi:hypothetical protein